MSQDFIFCVFVLLRHQCHIISHLLWCGRNRAAMKQLFTDRDIVSYPGVRLWPS